MTVFNDVCSLYSSAVIHRPSNRKLISCVARYLVVGLIVVSTWPWPSIQQAEMLKFGAVHIQRYQRLWRLSLVQVIGAVV